MIFHLEKTTILTSLEFTRAGTDYLVQWQRIVTGSKKDIRHRVTVLKNFGTGTGEKWDRILDTDFIIHDHMPTEKRSKKYLQIAITTK